MRPNTYAVDSSQGTTGCPISSVTPECYAFTSVSSEQWGLPSDAVIAGYIKAFSHCVIVTKRPRARMRSRKWSDTSPGPVVNMEVAGAERLSESLRSRAVGMVQVGIGQGEVTARIEVSRKQVNRL